VTCVQVELIMKVAEMCRKLETEEEKVLPFYASSLTTEEQEDVDAAVLEQPSEPLANVSTCCNTSLCPQTWLLLLTPQIYAIRGFDRSCKTRRLPLDSGSLFLHPLTTFFVKVNVIVKES